MRITDQMMAGQRTYQVNSAYARLANAQNVVSTDRQVNSPSDDPYGTSVALQLQAHITQNSQYSSTASDTLAWLQTTNAAISGVGDALTTARTLAVQGSNGTLTSDERQALAAQVGQLIQGAVQSANGEYAGRYVLSGYQTSTVPFSASSSAAGSTVSYHGDYGTMQREVSQGVTMQVNVTGNSGLPTVNSDGSTTEVGPLPDAFRALIQIQNDLLSGDTASLGGKDLTQTDSASGKLSVLTAGVASNITRVTALQTSLSTQASTLKGQLSNIVDADYAQATINYNAQKTTYQAALTVAGQSLPSLLDFLK